MNRPNVINRLCVTACFYHAMYMFQSESTLYSCLNVKELLAQNRANLAKWLSVHL